MITPVDNCPTTFRCWIIGFLYRGESDGLSEISRTAFGVRGEFFPDDIGESRFNRSDFGLGEIVYLINSSQVIVGDSSFRFMYCNLNDTSRNRFDCKSVNNNANRLNSVYLSAG